MYGFENLSACIGRGRRQRYRLEDGKIREVVSDVAGLIEAKIDRFEQPGGLFELVCGPLHQMIDTQLTATTLKRVGLSSGDHSDDDSGILSELDRKPVAHIELFHLPAITQIEDVTARPDTVDVGDKNADVFCLAGHRMECSTPG